MINRCISSSFGNSISFNPIHDDLTIKNYIALARCIVGIIVIELKKVGK